MLNGGFVVMNGGNLHHKVFVVIDNTDTNAIVRTNGHIISENQYHQLKWNCGTSTGNFVVPFGYNTTDYLPLTFNKITATSANISFSTWHTPANNLPWADSNSVAPVTNMNSTFGGSATTSVIDRWWDISTSLVTTADVTFSYRGAENTMNIGSTGALAAQHWNGTSWDMALMGNGNGVTSGIGNFKVNGISNFSPWVLVSTSAVLAVDWLDFEANCIENKIGIQGQFENNKAIVKSFQVEKSGSDLNFVKINELPAQNNFLEIFSFVDSTNIPSIAYYRIKAVNKDNSFSYSKVVGISPCDKTISGFDFQAYNNFSNNISLKIKNENQEVAELKIFDNESKLLWHGKINLEKGITQTSIPMELSSTQMIFVQLITSNQSETKKLIIVNP